MKDPPFITEVADLLEQHQAEFEVLLDINTYSDDQEENHFARTLDMLCLGIEGRVELVMSYNEMDFNKKWEQLAGEFEQAMRALVRKQIDYQPEGAMPEGWHLDHFFYAHAISYEYRDSE